MLCGSATRSVSPASVACDAAAGPSSSGESSTPSWMCGSCDTGDQCAASLLPAAKPDAAESTLGGEGMAGCAPGWSLASAAAAGTVRGLLGDNCCFRVGVTWCVPPSLRRGCLNGLDGPPCFAGDACDCRRRFTRGLSDRGGLGLGLSSESLHPLTREPWCTGRRARKDRRPCGAERTGRLAVFTPLACFDLCLRRAGDFASLRPAAARGLLRAVSVDGDALPVASACEGLAGGRMLTKYLWPESTRQSPDRSGVSSPSGNGTGCGTQPHRR